MTKYLLIISFLSNFLWAAIDFTALCDDLELVHWIDDIVERPLPQHYNYLFSTGYFVTPNARMSSEGVIGFGYGHITPYRHYSLLVQPLSRLELNINWRIFSGVEDQGLSPYGYGDFSDRGANLKVALVTPEDSGHILPGIAFGMEDFMGSKRFTSYYLVGTKVWQPFGLEATFGWGWGRYEGNSKGFFGGASWYPYFHKRVPLLRGLGFSAEYDPIDYSNDPHPEASSSSFPLNFGVHYSYNNLFHLSLSSWRGEEIAVTANLTYNLGNSTGFLPKVNNPPVVSRSYASNFSTQEIVQTFKEQGFILRSAYLCNDLVILNVTNCLWLREQEVRHRLASLLGHFPYSDVERFIVVVEAYHLKCQSYCFRRDWIAKYCQMRMGAFEFDLLTHRKEPITPFGTPLYQCIPYKPGLRLSPRFETFFGSAKGKFKYDFGIQAHFEGLLPYNLYYEALTSVVALSTLNDVSDFDRYHPSQLPNVATDYINYRNQGTYSTDKLYLQATKNFPCAFFARLAGGYFQVNYAGVAGEFLWYPANSCVALGVEGALVKKRRYNGLGFQSKIRTLSGTTPTYRPYTILDQYFLDIYFDLPECSLFTKVSIGSFLAHDKGARFALTRYFPSGLRVTAWLSVTNAEDSVHSVRYFDRGIAIELPFELFCTRSCRRSLSYGLAAWLRDAGYRTTTGRSLFDILNRERRY